MYIGIDLGTSGVKVILLNEQGEVVAAQTEKLTVSRPHPLWSEQDPEQWWQATDRAMKALGDQHSLQDVKALGIAGQMQAEEGPLLALTRAWTLVRFVESGLLQLSSCNCCGGNFITHAHQPVGSFACSLCQPPSRAVKRRKLSQNPADIIPQLLDEQRVQAV